MQGTEHDIALFLALGCAADFHIKILYELPGPFFVLYCIVSYFFGAAAPVFTPKRFKQHGGMLALFWYCASGFPIQNR